jgi:hypothetical protein
MLHHERHRPEQSGLGTDGPQQQGGIIPGCGQSGGHVHSSSNSLQLQRPETCSRSNAVNLMKMAYALH